MAVFNLSTSEQLVAALEIAKAGDEIKLATGTYSDIDLKDLNFTGTVKITSANPNKPAIFSGLNIEDCSNLSFSRVQLDARASASIYDFLVTDSSKIAFDRIELKGLATGPTNLQFGLIIRNSTTVSITNSEIHDLRNGIFSQNNTGVEISGNNFHDLESDGFQSAGSSNVTVTNNLFTDFTPVDAHPDAIQFFTGGTTTPGTNITITGNVIARGEGEVMQGIFVTDQIGLAYSNVTISDNLLIGTMFNGITAINVTSGSITNNIILGLPDMTSWIRVQDAPTVSIAGNTATTYAVNGTNAVPSGNLLVAQPTDGGTEALRLWLETHADPGAPLASTKKALAELQAFGYLPPSVPVGELQINATDGFVGAVRASGKIIGTSEFQDITVLPGSGAITLDPSFNRGGDIVRLQGNASAYTITMVGSSAVVAQGDMSVTIPVGTIGLSLVFEDGARKLVLDTVTQQSMIASQIIGPTEQPITAAANGAPTSSADADLGAIARVLISGGNVELGGNFTITGSNQPEQILLWGSATFDPSFGRGDDEIVLPFSAQNYSAQLFGSKIVLTGDDAVISVPLGTLGIVLDFAGDERIALFDAATSTVLIGDQAITSQPLTLETVLAEFAQDLSATPGGIWWGDLIQFG